MGDFFGGSSSVSLPPPSMVNIPGVQNLAQQTAQQNLTASLGLQGQVYPGLNAAQNAAVNTVGTNVNNPVMFNPVGLPVLQSSPLLNAAYTKAQSDLALGGELPADVQAQVARQAGAGAFASGLRGPGLAGVTAADLGLTSLGLEQQRLQNASSLGQVQNATNVQQQALQSAIDQFNSQYGANVSLQNRAQDLAGLGGLLSIGMPASGLSPGDIAGLSVANTNSQNSYNLANAQLQAQQNNSNNGFFGNLLGLGLGAAFAPLTGGTSLAGSLFNGVSSLGGGLLSSLFPSSNSFVSTPGGFAVG